MSISGPNVLFESQKGWYSRIWHIYRKHFRVFIAILAPGALFSFMGIQAYLAVNRQITAYLWRRRPSYGSDSYHFLKDYFWWFMATGGVRILGYWVSWLALSFSMCAIGVAVKKILLDDIPTPEQCYRTASENFMQFLRGSTILYLLVILGFAVSMFVANMILSPLLHYSSNSITFITVITFLLAILFLHVVVTRFLFAYPIFGDEKLSTWVTLRRSEEMTEPYRWKILWLLLESELIGYISALAPFWIARWASSRIALPNWTSWGLTGLSFAGASIAQLPFMIGVSVLYQEALTRPKPETDPATY